MSVVLLFEGERHQQSTVALRTRRYRFKLDPHLDDSLFDLRDEIIELLKRRQKRPIDNWCTRNGREITR
jgi:hypothetical protein